MFRGIKRRIVYKVHIMTQNKKSERPSKPQSERVPVRKNDGSSSSYSDTGQR